MSGVRDSRGWMRVAARALALGGLAFGVDVARAQNVLVDVPLLADGTAPPAPVPTVLTAPPRPIGVHPFFAAPGNFGMSWGTPSFGSKRTYSEFASPYGGGYAYGYAPYGLLPGRHGVELWRGAGAVPPGTIYGGPESYRTFPAPYRPGPNVVTPPVGVYAPALGPGLPGRWGQEGVVPILDRVE